MGNNNNKYPWSKNRSQEQAEEHTRGKKTNKGTEMLFKDRINWQYFAIWWTTNMAYNRLEKKLMQEEPAVVSTQEMIPSGGWRNG